MNTDTGRIYQPDEMAERLSARAMRRGLDTHQAEFEQELDAGRIVPVSDAVAHTMKLGQRERERRDRRRKSAKAARKRNRA